ncbi:hypothetical protein [Pseudoalteromonas piscicida]|uniref:Lipoprotein n=1 Tax=Pseudoalteromonas piscicida TaxID=43662 RepID=A0A2A5JNN2_PSEO7|nr:hypothetical protein [Pseudoalteromonas piscicida]PCK31053.1 hypothetical protein CEX98_14335 [Pseudoalteromonas piscicida]
MKGFKLLVVFIISITFMAGCAVGHNDYVNFMDSRIGQVMKHRKPYKFANAGQFSRGDFVINGQGLTHITKNESGDLIYHYSDQEVLSNAPEKRWVGKCLFYYVVEPETYIIKNWGFDKGGNPLSCRTWP